MRIVIDGIEKELDKNIIENLKKICELDNKSPGDKIISILEGYTENFIFDTFCEHCGCKRAKYLGDLEHHKGDCPNIPF